MDKEAHEIDKKNLGEFEKLLDERDELLLRPISDGKVLVEIGVGVDKNRKKLVELFKEVCGWELNR